LAKAEGARWLGGFPVAPFLVEHAFWPRRSHPQNSENGLLAFAGGFRFSQVEGKKPSQ
jgi:hypothetical protein